MNGPGTYGECGCDIALQRVAYHKQLRRVYLLMLAECEKLLLSFVGRNLHIVEIVQQS